MTKKTILIHYCPMEDPRERWRQKEAKKFE